MTTQAMPDFTEYLAPGEPRESLAWRSRIIQRCRWLSDRIWRHWYELHRRIGYVEANLWLTRLEQRLKLSGTGLSIEATDCEIKDYANAKTRQIALDNADFLTRFDRPTALWAIKTLFEKTGLAFPINDKDWQTTYSPKKVLSGLARIQDPYWLAQQLRRKASRELEQLRRELGLVGRGTAPYISEMGLRRVLERKNSNRNLLEKLVATNDLGQSFSLAELSDLGVSNPTLRRNELMTRMNGFEVWTDQDSRSWKAMFYTLTTPSKFHPMTMKSGKTVKNSKYNGATPKDAQKHLNTVWQRARAEAARQGLTYFGIRVAEPHHDGTPHWHLLVFVLEGHEKSFTDNLRTYALQEDATEPGAQKHRFEAVVIDPKKGRATGYIAKYIAKNIDGFKVEIDDEAQEYSSLASIRASCWSSLWGIRQFQQIGGPPVTVWRELRRLDPEEIDGLLQQHERDESADIRAIQEAADTGDWCRYVMEMGGPTVKRKNLPIRAMYLIKPDASTYGEDLRRLIGLVTLAGESLNTRPREWTIGLRKPEYQCGDMIMRTGPPEARPLEYCQ